ncbi:MAG: hypothetical protein D6719_07025 [Candidatus Dadabacteria bacterium]|nr:MAG: hypothetical protein D6719_07025 [Candidatus Dadabacteria bacterium]
MTLTIVKGLSAIAKAGQSGSRSNQQITQGAAQSARASQQVASTEAAHTSLRPSRPPAGDKIKDIKEARNVARSVADRVRTDDAAVDAHGMLEAEAVLNHYYE